MRGTLLKTIFVHSDSIGKYLFLFSSFSSSYSFFPSCSHPPISGCLLLFPSEPLASQSPIWLYPQPTSKPQERGAISSASPSSSLPLSLSPYLAFHTPLLHRSTSFACFKSLMLQKVLQKKFSVSFSSLSLLLIFLSPPLSLPLQMWLYLKGLSLSLSPLVYFFISPSLILKSASHCWTALKGKCLPYFGWEKMNTIRNWISVACIVQRTL